MTDLEVQLTANIKELKKNLKEATKKVKDFGKDVNNESTQAGKGFQKVGKGASNATPALQEFSRVIQDAPFGIQGVGNNLQQLTANFGNLSTKAGGSKAALKAMVGALAGPGGVLLAVSAVTSLLTVFSSEIAKAFKSTDELVDSTKEFVTSARSEISVIESLISVGKNINLSYKVRQTAIDKLNDKYPNYLGNLDQESIKSDETAKAVNRLTKSLIQQAKIRGVQANIEKRINDRSGDLTKGLVARQVAARAVEGEINNLISKYGELINVEGTTGLGERTSRVFKQLEKNLGGAASGIGDRLNRLVNDFVKTDRDVKAVESGIGTSIKELEAILNNFQITGFTDTAEDLGNGVTVIGKKLKAGVNKVKNDFVNLRDVFGVNESAQKSLDKFRPDFSNFAVQFNKLGDIVGFAIKDSVKKITPQLSIIEQRLIAFNESASQIIQGSIAGTFQQLGQAIGQSLIQGGNVFSAIGQTIISGIGQFLSKMGGLLIEYGTLAVLKGKLDLAILAGGPVAIGAGIAAIAVGTAISAIGAAFSSAASGGSTVGGQSGSSGGFSAGNSVGGSSGNFGGGTVVFEISGQKLVGVLNRTLNGNSRLGGNLTIG